MNLLTYLKEWFQLNKDKLIFYYNWRVAPNQELKDEIKQLYEKKRIAAWRMNKLLAHLETHDYKAKRDESWYVGDIPNDWEKRINDRIEQKDNNSDKEV